MILRLRAAEYKFTEKKALAVTAITAEGVESKPLAATGGPDLADIRFSAEPKERDALLATRHLDIRTEEATVRLSFEGLDEVQSTFKQCLANIGSAILAEERERETKIKHWNRNWDYYQGRVACSSTGSSRTKKPTRVAPPTSDMQTERRRSVE